MVSRITWENLKPEYQEALKEAARATQEFNSKAIAEADQEAYEALERAGVTIIEPEDLDAWRAAMEPVYEKYGADYLDLIDKIQRMK